MGLWGPALLWAVFLGHVTKARLGSSVPARPREESEAPEALSEFHTPISRSFGTQPALHGKFAF